MCYGRGAIADVLATPQPLAVGSQTGASVIPRMPRWASTGVRRDVLLFLLGTLLTLVVAIVSSTTTPSWATKFISTQNAEQARNDALTRQAISEILQDPGGDALDKAMAEAYSLQFQGNTQQAIEMWRSIARISEGADDTRAANAWFNVGYLLREDNETNLDDVIAAYDEALRLNPDMAEAYNNRGVAYFVANQHDRGFADLDTAISLQSDFVEAYFNRGAANVSLEQYASAESDLDQAIRLRPTYADAHYARGLVEARLERYASGIERFNEAIRLRPRFAEAYFERGEAKSHLGRYVSAVVDYTEAIRGRSDFVQAYVSRGIARAMNGDYEEAFDDLDLAVRLQQSVTATAGSRSARGNSYLPGVSSPDFAAAFFYLGFLKSARGQVEEAVVDYGEAIRLRPEFPEAYGNRGVAKFALGQYGAALFDYDEAIRLMPGWRGPYYYRGLAKGELGQHGSALIDFDEAIQRLEETETRREAAMRSSLLSRKRWTFTTPAALRSTRRSCIMEPWRTTTV